MESKYEPKDCDICLNKNCAIKIQYGEPNDKIFNLAQMGKIKLGGCNISENNYYCKNCKASFVKKN